MVAGLLVQATVPLARIATTYAALDIGLGPRIVGLLSATFAILPVFLTVGLGRFNDRGGSRTSALAGGVILLAATALLMLAQPALPILMIATSALGIGQTLVLAAMQLMISRSSSRMHRDAMLGNYMVAVSLGQALGPLLLGWEGARLSAPFAGSLLLVVVLAVLWRVAPRPRNRTPVARIPLSSIAATRGLPWLVGIGSICVASQDLVLAFVPLLGEERGVPPAVIGLLLSLRAVSAMVSRLFFSHAVRRFGRARVMTWSLIAGGAGLIALGLPMPVWGMALSMIAIGFGIGIALTSTVSLTLIIAPPSARGTSLSLRLTANRVAQFCIPLLASLIMAPFGAAGVLAILGITLCGVTPLRPHALGKGGDEPMKRC